MRHLYLCTTLVLHQATCPSYTVLYLCTTLVLQANYLPYTVHTNLNNPGSAELLLEKASPLISRSGYPHAYAHYTWPWTSLLLEFLPLRNDRCSNVFFLFFLRNEPFHFGISFWLEPVAGLQVALLIRWSCYSFRIERIFLSNWCFAILETISSRIFVTSAVVAAPSLISRVALEMSRKTGSSRIAPVNDWTRNVLDDVLLP